MWLGEVTCCRFVSYQPTLRCWKAQGKMLLVGQVGVCSTNSAGAENEGKAFAF